MTAQSVHDRGLPGDRAHGVVPLRLEDVDLGVLPRFRIVATALPDAVAVADARGELTYRDLAASAAARLLVVQGADRPAGEPIGLLHPHRRGAVASLLAALASGHPVVVLDPRTPVGRLRVMAERAGLAAILAHPDTAEAADQVADEVLLPDPGARDRPETLWQSPPAADAPAVLAFTSGSTGLPKAVVNDHRMLVHDAWTNSVATGCYDADDVVAHTLPLAFHAGLMISVAGLVVGSRLELYDVRGNGIAQLPAWLDRVGATIMHSSPAILRAFVATAPDPALLRRLRSLTIAGETAHGTDVEAVRALLPPTCVVRNRYGSSETGLIAEYPVPSDHPALDGSLPVGLPVGDTRLEIVDEDGAVLPHGGPGVLAVTSSAPGSGYWNDSAATAACFRDNPDGTRTVFTRDVAVIEDSPHGPVFRLMGRRDHSVKIRGNLVEPGEVDVELFALPDVAEAVTVAGLRPDGESQRLISYVVSTAEQPSAAAVRKALRERLPDHMVPEIVIFLSAVPRSDRGKIDRSALPDPPEIGGPETYGEVSDWEQAVADVWARALALDSVGPDQDFFELGGDSLAAEAIMSALVSELGIEPGQVTATTLTEAPTARAFADRVRRAPDPLGAVLVPLNPLSENTSDEPAVFFVAGGGGMGVAFVALARSLGERASYALQMHGMERRGLPDWTVARAARRYIAAMRSVQPQGPYLLAGHSYGGLVAFEMAHRLRAAGEQVAQLAILDSFPPDPAHHPRPEPRPLHRRIKAGLGLAATGWATRPGTGNYWRFFDMTSFIGRHYRSRPYPGPAVVVVADTPEKADRSAWAQHLSGDWELVEVPGDHLSMLREPHVGALAEALRKAFSRR